LTSTTLTRPRQGHLLLKLAPLSLVLTQIRLRQTALCNMTPSWPPLPLMDWVLTTQQPMMTLMAGLLTKQTLSFPEWLPFRLSSLPLITDASDLSLPIGVELKRWLISIHGLISINSAMLLPIGLTSMMDTILIVTRSVQTLQILLLLHSSSPYPMLEKLLAVILEQLIRIILPMKLILARFFQLASKVIGKPQIHPTWLAWTQGSSSRRASQLHRLILTRLH
jgi:hypothetical protein